MVIDERVDKCIRDTCIEIGKRYERHFFKIGTDEDHVHFLVQSVPSWSISRLVTAIKNITAKRVFENIPELKKDLWGSSLWMSGYYASPVGKRGNEDTISRYVKEQGRQGEYQKIHSAQLTLF